MKNFTNRKKIKYLHEGNFVAEIKINVSDSQAGWSPTMSIETAYKLDDIRDALRHGDLDTASQYATIYEMKKIAI